MPPGKSQSGEAAGPKRQANPNHYTQHFTAHDGQSRSFARACKLALDTNNFDNAPPIAHFTGALLGALIRTSSVYLRTGMCAKKLFRTRNPLSFKLVDALLGGCPVWEFQSHQEMTTSSVTREKDTKIGFLSASLA